MAIKLGSSMGELFEFILIVVFISVAVGYVAGLSILSANTANGLTVFVDTLTSPTVIGLLVISIVFVLLGWAYGKAQQAGVFHKGKGV